MDTLDEPLLPTPVVHGDYFKFDTCWSKEQACCDQVHGCWNADGLSTLDKIKHVGATLATWQRDRRKSSTARIRHLQRMINEMMTKPLSVTELASLSDAKAELKGLIDKDEAYWSQRSRVH
ncbi:hypothetical protein V6N13_014584 [Hibiscus sabdariffa]|uniref:Uncharacterized protein n=1 Tax=Hibiscus sabdariffa TaxID=183260 RepID=A0ABR2RWA3_9ROSI